MLYLIGSRKPFRWRGEWNPNAYYEVDDCVYYQSTSYICIMDNTNKAPDSNPEYWDELIMIGNIDGGVWS